MRMMTAALTAIGVAGLAVLSAQEPKPVPKGSQRVAIPGCAKGYILTAGRRSEAQPGSIDIPEGMHLRMNGPKKLIKEIQAHEGQMLVITGLVKTGQPRPEGIAIGGNVRVGPGPQNGIGSAPSQVYIDVEGWRPGVGECRR